MMLIQRILNWIAILEKRWKFASARSGELGGGGSGAMLFWERSSQVRRTWCRCTVVVKNLILKLQRTGCFQRFFSIKCFKTLLILFRLSSCTYWWMFSIFPGWRSRQVSQIAHRLHDRSSSSRWLIIQIAHRLSDCWSSSRWLIVF